MPMLLIYLVLIIAVAFAMGMFVGSARKEREYQNIIDTIFQRKYLVQENDVDSSLAQNSEFEFMVLKNGKSIKPVFPRIPNNKSPRQIIRPGNEKSA